MAGQEKSDGVVFAPQPFGRQPWLDLRQHDGRRVGRAAEHIVLPHGRSLVAALACRQDRLGAGEHPRAIGIQRIERAGGGETFDTRLLIARGLTRAAKSASEVNRPSLRASTISSTA